MRISTAWMAQTAINTMLNQQARLAHTQLQMSTGLSLTEPADNPGAAVAAQKLGESLQLDRQYQTNLGTARSRLQFEDSALGSADNILQRARELTVQSLNDTLTPQDRKALGLESQQLLDQMLGTANTQNANGEYIFGGYQTDAPPFALDSARTPPSYVYQGDKNQRQLQVGAQRSVADGDTGYAVFENVPSTSGGLALAASGGKQSILNTLYTLTQTLNGTFTGSHGAVTGTADLTQGKDYSAGPQSFDLAVDGGPAVTVSVAAANYPTADALATAINAGIGATPLDGKVTVQVRNGSLELVSANTGDASSVTVSNGTPGLLADAGFGDPQTGSGAAASFHDAATATLTDLDNALQSVLNTRADEGARLKVLDEQENLQSKFIVDTQISLAGVQDLDYAEAISQFTQQQTVLQASQQAFSQVQKLSLFNYL